MRQDKADAQELPSGPDFSHELQIRRYCIRVRVLIMMSVALSTMFVSLTLLLCPELGGRPV